MERCDASIGAEECNNHAAPIRRSIRYMQSRLGEKVTLEEMAGIACMSPFHYLRVFQGLTGVPPARFLGALRLEAAKNLLLRNDRPVFDICQDVGYSSLGTFTSRFGQLVGLAPARYREMYRELRSGVTGTRGFPRSAESGPRGQLLQGRIEHELGDEAVLFVGLFTSRIPQDLPLTCDVLAGSREFHLVLPEGDGPFYVLTVGLLPVVELTQLFDNRSLIGGVAASGVVSASDIERPVRLRLRDPDLLDPPILVAFPLLMHLQLGALPIPAPRPSVPTLLASAPSVAIAAEVLGS